MDLFNLVDLLQFTEISESTVVGWNLAPPEMYEILKIMG